MTVGIEYVVAFSSRPEKPYEVRIAIAVSDHEQEDLFRSVESAEARTRYVKKWNVSVTKKVVFEDLKYLFTLRCWERRGK